ncbi:MAG: hypothetical protein MRY59_02775 [Aquisalinus sp.]|nr:hypothetical protein [Aquisalinus sp.]
MTGYLTILYFILIIFYGLAQLVAGFAGIEYHWGFGWALGVVGISLLTRVTIIITIAAFIGAKDVWGWHWLAALIFAAPGIIFMVAALIPSAFKSLTRLK